MNRLHQELEQLRKELQLETAIVSKIEGDQYTIQDVDSELPVFNIGDVFELQNTYCSAVHASSQTIVYNNVGEMEEMLLHPVYVAMQLLSYIGTPILLDGKIWGTLNFSSTLLRKEDFSYAEIKSVESLAKQYSEVLSQSNDQRQSS